MESARGSGGSEDVALITGHHRWSHRGIIREAVSDDGEVGGSSPGSGCEVVAADESVVDLEGNTAVQERISNILCKCCAEYLTDL